MVKLAAMLLVVLLLILGWDQSFKERFSSIGASWSVKTEEQAASPQPSRARAAATPGKKKWHSTLLDMRPEDHH